jgi:hypothetical protein
MVKRTRRKNKSKKRTNRKRTTRRLRGGANCLTWCSNCGEGSIGISGFGLCYDAAESKTQATDCYKCNCGFKLVNPIARHIITSNYNTINGEFEVNYGNAKIKSDKLNSLKQIYREKMTEFNNVCNNRKYTVFEIDLLTTTESGVQTNNILDNIRKLAIGIGMNMGVESVRSLEAPKKLLKWLPLKESDFYISTASQVVSSLADKVTKAFE